jgi:hypothetical protein
MKCHVIACKVMEEEMRRCQRKDTTFVFLDQGLHMTPKLLREKVQQEVDKASRTDDDFVLIGYGLCGNGILGVQARGKPLILPAIHDCISLFLGSGERYYKEFRKESGTFFLSPGWIDGGETPLSLYEEYKTKYEADTAKWMIEEQFKDYKRVVLIDTKISPIDEYRVETKKNADFLGLQYGEIQGSPNFFKKFLTGNWDHDFIVTEIDQELTQDLYNAKLYETYKKNES